MGRVVTRANAVYVRASYVVWLVWVLTTTLGGALGLVAARVLTNIYDIYLSNTLWLNFGVAVVAGSLVWLAVSIPQALILRLHLPKLIGWIPATVLSGAVAVSVFLFIILFVNTLDVSYSGEFGISFGGTYLDGALLVGFAAVVAGMFLGLAQWRVFARHIANAGWWVWSTVLAWGVALLVGGAVSEAIIETGREKWSNVADVVIGYGGVKPGILIIALYAVISGFALMWLLQEEVSVE